MSKWLRPVLSVAVAAYASRGVASVAAAVTAAAVAMAARRNPRVQESWVVISRSPPRCPRRSRCPDVGSPVGTCAFTLKHGGRNHNKKMLGSGRSDFRAAVHLDDPK